MTAATPTSTAKTTANVAATRNETLRVLQRERPVDDEFMAKLYRVCGERLQTVLNRDQMFTHHEQTADRPVEQNSPVPRSLIDSNGHRALDRRPTNRTISVTIDHDHNRCTALRSAAYGSWRSATESMRNLRNRRTTVCVSSLQRKQAKPEAVRRDDPNTTNSSDYR